MIELDEASVRTWRQRIDPVLQAGGIRLAPKKIPVLLANKNRRVIDRIRATRSVKYSHRKRRRDCGTAGSIRIGNIPAAVKRRADSVRYRQSDRAKTIPG